jgi:subtilase family serine protease
MKKKNTTRRRSRICAVERLESRALLSAAAPIEITAYPALEFRTSKTGADQPSTTSEPQGFTAIQISRAYGFNQLAKFSPTLPANGLGQTIAIVDNWGDPNIQSDLQAFDAANSLPAAQLTIAPLFAPGFSLANPPTADPTWAPEVALDVEWAHAAAPGAKILLVEAQNENYLLQAWDPDLADGPGLLDGVQYAAEQPGVSVVSMSWTAPEFAGENSLDSYFTSNSVNPGITFVTAAGDSGPPANWPASSPNVLAVGGTTLATDASGNYHSEIGWVGSGGGISLYETEPSYQYGAQRTGDRTTPDVAYDGDPNTGFSVYCSYGNSAGSGNWLVVGGTSAGTPQWAGIIAIANEGRAASGKTALESATADIYQLPAADFHDVTSGFNGYPAGPGYDLVTGRGTPYVNRIVPGLVGVANSTASSAAPASVAAQARLKSALAVAARVHAHTTAEVASSTVAPAETTTPASLNASLAEPVPPGPDREAIAGQVGSPALAEPLTASLSWPARQGASFDTVEVSAPVAGGDSDAFDALGPSIVAEGDNPTGELG